MPKIPETMMVEQEQGHELLKRTDDAFDDFCEYVSGPDDEIPMALRAQELEPHLLSLVAEALHICDHYELDPRELAARFRAERELCCVVNDDPWYERYRNRERNQLAFFMEIAAGLIPHQPKLLTDTHLPDPDAIQTALS